MSLFYLGVTCFMAGWSVGWLGAVAALMYFARKDGRRNVEVE